tara:strand:- start:1331 stop:1852 length:522 start_codon:yes stop_codon:yes gene_type:complete
MKNLTIAFLASFFIASCATSVTKKQKSDPYEHITVESLKGQCEAEESWQVSPFGLPGFVFMFKDCLKINKLVVISVQAKNGNEDVYTKEIRKESVKLLALHYTYFMDHRDYPPEKTPAGQSPTYSDNSGDLKWSLKKIKEESGNNWETHFYILSFAKANSECSGPTCARETLK